METGRKLANLKKNKVVCCKLALGSFYIFKFLYLTPLLKHSLYSIELSTLNPRNKQKLKVNLQAILNKKSDEIGT